MSVDGVISPRERIPAMVLVQGALARIGAQRLGLGLLFLAGSGLGVALEWGAAKWGVAPGSDLPGANYPYYLAALAVLDGGFQTMALRLILVGRLRLDRGVLECMALIALQTLAFSLMARTNATDGVLGSAFQAVAILVGLYLSFRLTLWPIGRLMGRREVTPARSWLLMRGAMLSLAAANILAFLPVLAVSLLVMGIGLDDGLAGQITDTVIQQAYSVFSVALSATVYVLRTEQPTTLADVFD